MALNFSSCSVFPTPFIHSDDESSCAGFKWSPLNSLPYSEFADAEWMFDPADLLPDDPFGMGLDGSMGAAIASFIEANGGDLFEWTLMNSPEFQFYHDGWLEEEHSWVEDAFSGLSVPKIQDGESSLDIGESSKCNHEETCPRNEGLPHEAFVFVLGHLNFQDLLSVEGVCRSLHAAVRCDFILWTCLHLDSPLSDKLTDDALLRLAQRFQGNLQCLSLSGCSKITNDGLKRVLNICPMLRKLNVSGCVRLSVDGIISSLKELQSQGVPGIQNLKLGKLFIVSREQYSELKSLLRLDQLQLVQPQKSRFYHTYQLPHHCDDDCVLDFEICPLCGKYKLVYDCPSESCQEEVPKRCRACDFCILRCVRCGTCIKDLIYMETFCLDYICSSCWSLPPLNEREEEK